MDTIEKVYDFYNNGAEIGRLESGLGMVEFYRSKEIISQYIPENCTIYDIGGGKYAQDYMKANISTAMAATLNFALENQHNETDMKLVFDFTLIAHKKSLKNAMNLEKSSSKKYKVCANDLKSLNAITFDQFLSQCGLLNNRLMLKSKKLLNSTGSSEETENIFSYDDYIIIGSERNSVNDNEYAEEDSGAYPPRINPLSAQQIHG